MLDGTCAHGSLSFSANCLCILVLTAATTASCRLDSVYYCPDAPLNNCNYRDDATAVCTGNADCTEPTPVCDRDGTHACVQCLAPDLAMACTGATPMCGDDHACRGCAAHTECPGSDVCLPDGSCADAGQVAYVQAGGTSALPCAKAAPCGVLQNAIAAVDASRPYIKLARPGTLVAAAATTIDGKAVNTGADVRIYDLEITGASGAAGDVGISLPAGGMPKLTLTRVKVTNNQGGGIAASGGSLSVSQSTLSGRRVRAALAKITRTLDAVPAAARRAALDLRDALHGLLDGLATARHLVEAGTGRRLALLDPGAIPRAIQRVRSARAMESAASAMTKLRGPVARAQGQGVLARLHQLADRAKMPGAIDAVAHRSAKGPDKAKLVAALDRLLGTWPAQLEPEVLAHVLQRVGGAGNPVAFLDDVAWAMTHHGLTPAARAGLLRHAARPTKPLDLRWLRELTDLSDETLEFLALDPATQWMDLMKVSTRLSDYFPSSVKKLLTPSDYAQAAGKLRGIAGELTIAVEGIELPGGLRIVGRQVKAGSRTIDFELQNALGQKVKLEVKAWSPKTWERELANPARIRPKSLLGPLIEQLRAAKATGSEVYLAVPDSIGSSLASLETLLRDLRLDKVRVIRFSESKLKNTISKLRLELGLAAGVGLVSADQLVEIDDEP
jgi:hypothetical protein